MSDIAPPVAQVVTSEQTACEAALEQSLAEAGRLNELMQQDRADIERLRIEAWALRAETRAVLAGMGAQL